MITNLKYPCFSLDDPSWWQKSLHPGKVTKLQYKTHWYNGTKGTPFEKPICLYLPYNYDLTDSYDLLVLLPGMDMSCSCYLSRAHRYSSELYSVQFQNVIDNLIDTGEIDPLIIVTLPYYGATTEGHPVMELDSNQLVQELRRDLLPYMYTNYSIKKGCDHCGIFGFSYTSAMILQSIMPYCYDLFSWYGASSIFHYDLNGAVQVVSNNIRKGFVPKYLYVGCGVYDDACAQTKEMYDTFCDLVPGIEDISDLIVLPNTGHDARTYDTAIINCLLKFFDKETEDEQRV